MSKITPIENNDSGPEEPELNTLIGFDDCQNCFFRLSTVQWVTDSVKQLRRGGV